MMTAQPFTCVFILQALWWILQTASADPTLTVSHTSVYVGLTSSLDINCTFNLGTTSNMAGLISLSLSRISGNGSNPSDTEQLADINEFSDHTVNLHVKDEDVIASGLLSQGTDSYLNLHWSFPADQQAGVYVCSAHGLNFVGQNVDPEGTATVTVHQATLGECLSEMSVLDVKVTSLEQQLSNMDTYAKSLEQKLADTGNCSSTSDEKALEMETNIKLLLNIILPGENASTIFEDAPLSYKDSKYYISRQGFRDVNISLISCRLFLNGYLAEIDDVDEYHVLQNFLETTTGSTLALVAGSDQVNEGQWVLQSTQQPLPFVEWVSGRPANDTSRNCLFLGVPLWRMVDYFCHMDTPDLTHRFICEVPQN